MFIFDAKYAIYIMKPTQTKLSNANNVVLKCINIVQDYIHNKIYFLNVKNVCKILKQKQKKYLVYFVP